jgi:gas vesicle protein
MPEAKEDVMTDESGTSPSGIILSFMLGALSGAALAVLFAPRSGEETRELLEEKLRRSAERGKELRDRAVEKGREVLDDAGEYLDRQRESLEKRRDRLTTAVEAGRQAYRQEKEKM